MGAKRRCSFFLHQRRGDGSRGTLRPQCGRVKHTETAFTACRSRGCSFHSHRAGQILNNHRCTGMQCGTCFDIRRRSTPCHGPGSRKFVTTPYPDLPPGPGPTMPQPGAYTRRLHENCTCIVKAGSIIRRSTGPCSVDLPVQCTCAQLEPSRGVHARSRWKWLRKTTDSVL